MYYKTCPNCGAHLDPGELCDCLEKEEGRPVKEAPNGPKDATKSKHHISMINQNCSDTLRGALDHRREGQSERVQVVYGYNGASQFGYNLKSGVYTIYLSRDEDDIEGSVKGLMLGIAAHRAVMRECAASHRPA